MVAGDEGLGPDGLAEEVVSRSIPFIAALGALLFSATGCGENCSTTCFRAYAESDCNVPSPGVPRDQRIDECIADCNAALDQAGPIGDYSPLASGSLTRVELENERQAAAWMDCIAESTCEQLVAGRCSPL